MLEEWYDEENHILWEKIGVFEDGKYETQRGILWDANTCAWWRPSEYQYVPLTHIDTPETESIEKHEIRKGAAQSEIFSELMNDVELHPQLFTFACKTNNTKLASSLVLLPTVDHKKGALIACKKNHQAIVSICLEKDPFIINDDSNKMLYYAVKKNHAGMCKYLLSLPKLEITTHLLQTILNYQLSGIVIEQVLQNPALLSSVLNANNYDVNEAIYFFTIENGLYDAYLVLCAHVIQSPHDDYGLYLACKNGRTKVAFHLLDECVIDPQSNNQYAFETACKYGHVQIVEKFLQNRKIDIHLNNDAAFCLAIDNGRKEVINVLMKNGNYINPRLIDMYYELEKDQIQGIFGSSASLCYDLMHSDHCQEDLDILFKKSRLNHDALADVLSVFFEICWKENKIDVIMSILKQIANDRTAITDNMSDIILGLFVKACKFNIPIIAKYTAEKFDIRLNTHSLSEILPEILEHVEIEEIVLNTKYTMFGSILNADYSKYVQFIQSAMLQIAEETVKTKNITALRKVLRSIVFNGDQLESLFVLSCKEQNLDAARSISAHLDIEHI